MFKFQKEFSRLLVLPKPIGKAKRKLVLDDSDEQEEEEQPMSKSAKRAATRVATGRAFHFGKVYRSQQGSAATNTRLNTSGVPSENRGFQCRRHCGEGM